MNDSETADGREASPRILTDGGTEAHNPANSPNPETRDTDIADGTAQQRYVEEDIDDIPFDYEVREDTVEDSIVEGWRQHPRLVATAGFIVGSIVFALLLGLIPFFPNLTNPWIWVPTGLLTTHAIAFHSGRKSERASRKKDSWAMLKVDDKARPLRGRLTKDGMGGYLFYPVRGFTKFGYDKNMLTVQDVAPQLADRQGKQIEPDDEAAISVLEKQVARTHTEEYGEVAIVEGGEFDIDETHPTATLKVTIPEKANKNLVKRLKTQLDVLRTNIAELRQSRQTWRNRAVRAEYKLREDERRAKDDLKDDVTDILEGVTVSVNGGQAYDQPPRGQGQRNVDERQRQRDGQGRRSR